MRVDKTEREFREEGKELPKEVRVTHERIRWNGEQRVPVLVPKGSSGEGCLGLNLRTLEAIARESARRYIDFPALEALARELGERVARYEREFGGTGSYALLSRLGGLLPEGRE